MAALPTAVALLPLALALGPHANALAPVAVAVGVAGLRTQTADAARIGRGAKVIPSPNDKPVSSARRNVPLASVPPVSALPARSRAFRLLVAEMVRSEKDGAGCAAGALG